MIKCLKCSKEFQTKLKLSFHIRFFHHISVSSYNDEYGINRCVVCKKPLVYRNKTGYCKKHFDASVYSKMLWKNSTYRNLVIQNMSKPRTGDFKKAQSRRMKKMYEDHPEQREIRRRSMKKSWEEGKITKHNHSINKSRGESNLLLDLLPAFPNAKNGYTIRGKIGWFFPDILLAGDNIIIEYFGDFWHANPMIYSETDVVHHKLTAKEIWVADAKRIKKLEELGFIVEIVWEKDFFEDKEGVLKRITHLFDWESCAL